MPVAQRSRIHAAGLFCALAALVLVLAAPRPGLAANANEEVLRIGGAGGALGGIKLLAYAYAKARPGLRIEILADMGSEGSVRALLSGTVDLAVATRELEDNERAAGASAVAYAQTPVVLASSSAVPVDDLSSDELEKIYAGEKTEWSTGLPVQVVLQPRSATDVKFLAKFTPLMRRIMDTAYGRPDLVVAEDDDANAAKMETLVGSLGITTLAQIKSERRDLRLVALDGVIPTTELVRRGGYPFIKTFRFVTDAHADRNVLGFIAFARSREGREILDRSGHIPLGPAIENAASEAYAAQGAEKPGGQRRLSAPASPRQLKAAAVPGGVFLRSEDDGSAGPRRRGP